MRGKFFNSTLTTSKFQTSENKYQSLLALTNSGVKVDSSNHIDKLEISPLLNKSISCFDSFHPQIHDIGHKYNNFNHQKNEFNMNSFFSFGNFSHA